jgi:3-deoxy-D-manno-octulosonic acid kinase
MTALRWTSGAPALRAAVERALAPGAGATRVRVLHENARRRLLVVDGDGGGAVLLKQFRVGSGKHVLRERWKARLGWSPARREERALRALRAAGVPVPEPLGLAEQPDGDVLLALGFVQGLPLVEALRAPFRERRALLRALGGAVAALHAAGLAHGDLHAGNVLATERGPVLLDLQHARRRTGDAARAADLGWLDYSLWPHASATDRLRLRAAALGLARPYGADGRARLRAAGRAAERRAADHARSRTRRALRPGRLAADVRLEALRGLRARALPEPALEALLRAHAGAAGAALLKDDARARVSAVADGPHRAVVKEFRPRGLARALADLVRGSAARRAFRAGHGLRARGVASAAPLAYLEQRRFGLPLRSVVVLADLSPAPDGLEAALAAPEATLAALGRLALGLHRRGVDHGDLKCTNVHLVGPDREPHLVDLEGVRFRRVTEGARLEALAQLNASLPDSVSAPSRRRAFARYAARLPFARGRDAALREVVARSLARRHRWSGAGCALAERGAER